MATKKPKTIPYRRKREGKTNYTKRLKLLLSKRPRLVVRLTNTQVIAQLIEFSSKGDKVLVGIDSSSLKKMGWNHSFKNRSAAYLTGLLLGKKAMEKKLEGAVLDTGFKLLSKKGKLTAFFKGVIDSGFKVPYGSEEIFPDEETIAGKNITNQEKITEEFNKIKAKIMG
jgi:large subunit ribosomal protein L18